MDKKNKLICSLFACFFGAGFLLCVCLPKSGYSQAERRRLASFPSCSLEQILSGRFMSDFETYGMDHFPFRDSFRSLKAVASRFVFGRKDNHGIYLWDGYLAAVEYPRREESLDRAVERFRYIYEKYLTEENRVFLSMIPDKNCFLAKESGHLSIDYEKFEEDLQEKAGFADYISISDLLERDDYYRTDTHWRQERILDVAGRLLGEMNGGGTTETEMTEGGDSQKGDWPLEDFEVHTAEGDFYGVYAGQAALPVKPEKLQYLTGKSIDGCSVYDWQNQRQIPVYDKDAAAGRDPYEMFLSGSLSLLTIDNPNASSDRKLVIFRDSFGSSIAPLLIEGYRQITLVDIRYIHPDLLERYVDFAGCDVLFLYSTIVLNNSETIL